jgi:ribonuclease Z
VSSRELVVLGTASQAPTRRRNHNGYLLRWDGEGIMFDPGEGTQRQMLFAGVTASQIHRICITHFHGDHCLGLPGVLQRMSLDQVGHPVEICYPEVDQPVLERLRHASLFYEVVDVHERPVAGPGDVPGAAGVAGTGAGGAGGAQALRLEAWPLSHTVSAVGYRLTEPDGRRMLPEKLAEAGISGPDVGVIQREGRIATGDGVVRLEQVSEPRRGQRFAFVMDTRLCDGAFALAEGADMLVCEATFSDEDADLADEYGHLTAGQAGRIAAESGARLLVLTHFSQRYEAGDGQPLAQQAAAAFGGEVILADDLTRIAVPGRDDQEHPERIR